MFLRGACRFCGRNRLGSGSAGRVESEQTFEWYMASYLTATMAERQLGNSDRIVEFCPIPTFTATFDAQHLVTFPSGDNS